MAATIAGPDGLKGVDAQPLTALENGCDGRRAQLNGEASQRRVRLHRRAWRCLAPPAALAAHPSQHPYNRLFLSPSLALSLVLSSLSLLLAIDSLSFPDCQKYSSRAQPVHMRLIPLFALHCKTCSDFSDPERYQNPVSPALRAGQA